MRKSTSAAMGILAMALAGTIATVSCNRSLEKEEAHLIPFVDENAPLPRILITDRAMSASELQTFTFYHDGGAPWFPPDALPPTRAEEVNDDRYAEIIEQSFRPAATNVSTFSLGVDSASYSNVRRFLREGMLPPSGAVRVEEMVNYFSYDYTEPEAPAPFAVDVEVAGCPWDLEQRLVRIGVRTATIDRANAPPSNLVLLVDVSGSMSTIDRLPLVKEGLVQLVDELDDRDTVSIVYYANNVGIALEPTNGSDKGSIRGAIEALEASGGTRGGEAIQLAYRLAHENHVEGGINRVILATDGDFNVGVSDTDELAEMVAGEAKAGVSLTMFGVGRGNLNDELMTRISSQGNGTYHYLDTPEEARRVLVEQVGGTLITVAEDFKSQVTFNPSLVDSWRLVGYDARLLPAESFDDDSVKAGDIGAGLTTTVLYQVVLRGTEPSLPIPPMEEWDSENEAEADVIAAQADWQGELARVEFRYKDPGKEESRLLSFPIRDEGKSLREASDDFVFASAVAGFGMLLRESQYVSLLDFDTIADLARVSSVGHPDERRGEFVDLVTRAVELKARKAPQTP